MTQHDTTQHNTTQHNTTQHDTTQHNTTRHNTTKLLLGIFILFAFWQCEKEPLMNGSQSQAYDLKQSSIIKELLNEPEIQGMFSELSNCNFIVNNEGILDFSKKEDFYKTFDVLIKYDSIFEDTKDKYPIDPVFLAFEAGYGFNSLRSEIEDHVSALEIKDELTEANDPDNHHIVSDVFRTLLTPDCEVLVSNTLCIYTEEFGIGIGNRDYNLRDTVIYMIENVSDLETEVANLVLTGAAVTFLDVTDDISAQFSYTINDFSETIMLYNQTMIVGYEDATISYLWDMGDGNTVPKSNTAPFTYTYANDGVYTITLSVKVNGNIYRQVSHSVNISTSAGNAYCIADFNYTDDSEGTYYFTSTSTSTYGISSYSWDFGDNNTDSGISASNTFGSNGNYNVKLTITTIDGCTDTFEQVVSVDGATDCCIMNDREVFEYVNYIPQSRRLKLVFKFRNIWPTHFVTSKTINYRCKNNGSWTRTNADKIKTQWGGIFYDTDCEEISPAAGIPTVVEYNSKKAADTRHYWGLPFRIRRGSIYSTYYVDEEGVIDQGAGLSLHDENCN
jgi:PKD repeat protein